MKHGRGRVGDALRMLEVFASVGVQHCDLTHINIDGEKRGFRAHQSIRQLRTSLPYLVDSSQRRQNSVILRPHQPPAVFLVQLDDLGADALVHASPAAFLALRTSPGNYQAWVAITGHPDGKALARRLRQGTGADLTASGATRVAGTANYKRKYEPDFPIVAIEGAAPRRTVTAVLLDELGLLAPETPRPAPSPLRASRGAPRAWPRYDRCLEGARPAHHGDRPDISRADFVWCMTAIDWGWDIESTAAKLLEESEKARENGPRYAHATATNAAAVVDGHRRTR